MRYSENFELGVAQYVRNAKASGFKGIINPKSNPTKTAFTSEIDEKG